MGYQISPFLVDGKDFLQRIDIKVVGSIFLFYSKEKEIKRFEIEIGVKFGTIWK